MSTFIGSVLSRLNNPGLSPRAEAIFTQAMAKGNYRWGRKAKRTAGASIAIALREARKSDSLRDIAFFLDDSPISLSRAFQSVVSLLDFSLASTDPAVHLPILQAHLQSVICPDTVSPSPPQLPGSLVSVITQISLQAAVRTATSLSQTVSRHSPPLPLTNLPTPPTACALFILGMEAEARAPLPHLGELTRTLANRFALAPGVVSSRYKVLYDLIEEWIRHVPWLDQFVCKGKGASARSKVSKRSIVAKGIKDVIQFHQEIWLGRMQSQHKVYLDLEPDPDDEEEDQGDDDGVNAPTVALSKSSKNRGEYVIAPPPGERRKLDKKGNAMQAAYRRFLDPLSSGSLDAATFSGDVSLLTHMLTCSPDEFARARGTPPTRLQLLAASRGGSTADHIADEELFANGELEGLLRNEQEREALLPLFQLDWSEEISREEAAIGRCKSVAAETKRGAKRVDMDALARLLGHVDGDNNNEEDAVFPDSDNIDAYQWGWDDYTRRSAEQEDTEVISDWRPTSPADDNDDDIYGEFRNSAEDRYEEEI